MIYDYAAQQFDSLIGPLAGDGDYATGSRNISAGVSHRMNTGSSLFALKYNNVDVIDAILTTDIGEEYLLQKMVISDSTSGSVETKEFTGAQSISSTYRYQTDDHNRTINYYFRRVVMELGTNHQQGVEKGSVSYIVGDGEAVAIQATDHNQACKISVGKPVTLKIKPSEGYRLFGVWVGESIDSQQPVTDVSGPDENGELSVNLGKWYKTVYVNVRFAPVNTTGISQLVIRQYMVDSENNVTPITEGKVVAKGTGTQDKPFVTGDEVTLQGAQSLETDVYEDTSVIFMLTPPPNGDVKELKASMQGASDSERIPLGLTNTEGNTFTLNESTQKGRNTLEKTGCTFRGWNTEKDGSGTHYDIGANLVIHGSNVILYAEWVEGSGRNVGSPGTGESDSDTRMAFISMLMSAITLTASGLWLLRKYRLEKA